VSTSPHRTPTGAELGSLRTVSRRKKIPTCSLSDKEVADKKKLKRSYEKKYRGTTKGRATRKKYAGIDLFLPRGRKNRNASPEIRKRTPHFISA
jgi:hypothetical protein